MVLGLSASDSRRFEITVCPDCGNHQTAFALCCHQRADGEGLDQSKFVKMWVAPVSELHRLSGERDVYREALRLNMPHDHSAQTSCERPINGCERCKWEAEGLL